MRLPKQLFAVLFVAATLAGCSPLFVLRAGYEEAKILSRRQSIARLVEDPELPAETRGKLELVLKVREFAADSLQLDVGDSYTTFSQLDSDTLALVLSAARKDSFEPYTWWFPITGRVPYRAFFSEESAAKAVAKLESRGFDAYVRPTSAFSTLGWFNDPLVSSLLRYDSISLANTVVHEVFHNTIYLPGQAVFNESLAQFVGARGAVVYFCAVQQDPALCRTSELSWQDEMRFGSFLSGLVRQLEQLYSRPDMSSEQKIAIRERIFRESQTEYADVLAPQFRAMSFSSFIRTPLNNASLIARRIYYERLDLFERVYQRNRQDLLLTIQQIIEAAEADPDDPYRAVEQLLD